MISVTCNCELSEDEIIEGLVNAYTQDDMLKFIQAIESEVADVAFLRKIFEWSYKEMREEDSSLVDNIIYNENPC